MSERSSRVRRLQLPRERQALPAPARALPAAVVTGKVVPAPVHGKTSI